MISLFWVIKTLLLTMLITTHTDCLSSENFAPNGPEQESAEDFAKGLFSGFGEDDWANLFKEVESEIAEEQKRTPVGQPATAQESFTPSISGKDTVSSKTSDSSKKEIITESEPTFQDPETLFLTPSTITVKEKGKSDIISPTDAAFQAFVTISNNIITAIGDIEKKMMGAAISPMTRETYLSNQQPLVDKLEITLEQIKSKKVYTRMLLTPSSKDKKIVDDIQSLRKTLIANMHALQDCAKSLPSIDDEEASEEDKESLLRALAEGTPATGSSSTSAPKLFEKSLQITFQQLASTVDSITKMVSSSPDVTKAFEERRKEREKKATEAAQHQNKSGSGSSWSPGSFGRSSSGGGGSRSHSSFGSGGFGGGSGGFGSSYGGGSRWGSGSGSSRSSFEPHSSSSFGSSKTGASDNHDTKPSSSSGGGGYAPQPEKEATGPFATAAKAANKAAKALEDEWKTLAGKSETEQVAELLKPKKKSKDFFARATPLLNAVDIEEDEDKTKPVDEKAKQEFHKAKSRLETVYKKLFKPALLAGTKDPANPVSEAKNFLDFAHSYIPERELNAAIEKRGQALLGEWTTGAGTTYVGSSATIDDIIKAAGYAKNPASPHIQTCTDALTSLKTISDFLPGTSKTIDDKKTEIEKKRDAL